MDINSLERFIEAQKNTYDTALKEIRAGKKRTHWMWYIFPQLRGLGESNMSYVYGINGLEEAKAYLAHPLLSERLLEISQALLEHKNQIIEDIIGDIDAMKLRSSMTLFALISELGSVFHQVLDCFYNSKMDTLTCEKIKNNEKVKYSIMEIKRINDLIKTWDSLCLELIGDKTIDISIIKKLLKESYNILHIYYNEENVPKITSKLIYKMNVFSNWLTDHEDTSLQKSAKEIDYIILEITKDYFYNNSDTEDIQKAIDELK